MLKLTNLNKYYNEKTENLHIIKDLNLEVFEGDFISIRGKSGSGKSTLLNLLGMLDAPSSGNVEYMDKNIVKFSEDERNKYRSIFLGFVFQFHYLLPEFTALENIMLPALIDKKRNKSEIEKRAKELLEQVELIHRLNHKPSELSGGEKQRVAIARAMINNPKLILADEPTGNLDDETSQKINNIFLKLNKEMKQSIIVVTHSLELANIADRKLYLKHGTLEEI
ncbi:MAG: ABC transporter ATP-binding protein [Mollicutes bacterium]|nr:ABC transporter ATP-binding protein [Mollicutes bacterium]